MWASTNAEMAASPALQVNRSLAVTRGFTPRIIPAAPLGGPATDSLEWVILPTPDSRPGPPPPAVGWKRYPHPLIAPEISAMSRYYDRVIQIHPLPFDDGLLLDRIRSGSVSRQGPGEPVPDLTGERDRRTILLLNGLFNHHLD